MPSASLLDRSIKVLVRRAPAAFFRLAGVQVDPSQLRPTDVSVDLAEFRADQVFMVDGGDSQAGWALYLEYQLQPDPRELRGWFLKNAGLTAQLELPVILLVVYLTRAGRATFPEAYTAAGGGLGNEYRFEVLRLWEHMDRIRSGEVPELAPLLLLCEDEPTEATLREERELILQLPVTEEARADLLAVAVTVGTRYFPRALLESLFREELQMLKESGIIEDWIEEALREGERKGQEYGEQRGRREEAQRVLLGLLRRRFGELPASVVEQVRGQEPEWCEQAALKLFDAQSLEDLSL